MNTAENIARAREHYDTRAERRPKQVWKQDKRGLAKERKINPNAIGYWAKKK